MFVHALTFFTSGVITSPFTFISQGAGENLHNRKFSSRQVDVARSSVLYEERPATHYHRLAFVVGRQRNRWFTTLRGHTLMQDLPIFTFLIV